MNSSIKLENYPSMRAGESKRTLAVQEQMSEDALRGKYRRHCENHHDIPIFSQAWWLDATAGAENWSACLVEEGGRIIATMPYYQRRVLDRFPILTQPPLTQFAGPWFAPMDGKPLSIMSRQMKLMTELIDQLPTFAHFQQNWQYSHTNWLPFRWRGFSQSTSYTYMFPRLDDLDGIWNGFQSNIKTDIQKATRRFELEVRDDLDLEVFLGLNRQVFERQGIHRRYSDSYVRGLDAACRNRGVCKSFIAVDPQGRPHAGVYIVWDHNSAYYLLGGGNPELRSSGATSLCLWHAIKHSATVTQAFDFEGSVVEPIERFFRAFGAQQKSYLTVQKTPSNILATYLFLCSRLASR